jgi:hypothetical protein
MTVKVRFEIEFEIETDDVDEAIRESFMRLPPTSTMIEAWVPIDYPQ